jgi:LysM repeat protein
VNALRTIAALVVGLLLAGGSARADYQMKPGESLGKVARAIYGASAYELALAKLNRFPSPKEVQPGTVVRIPDLKSMVLTEGLSKEVEPEIDEVLAARYQYMKVENELRKSLARAPAGGKATIPAEVRKALIDIAKDLETAGRAMAKKGVYAESPVRVKQRLEEAAKRLRELANGKNDVKLADSIHRLLAQTWVRLLMWARLEDG